MPKILAVCSGSRKGAHKKDVVEAFFEKDYGLVGDSDAGPGLQQVSILSELNYTSFQGNGGMQMAMKMGSFCENLVIEGIELDKLRIGSFLHVNNVVLEVTKVATKNHKPYRDFDVQSEVSFPGDGVYAIVKQSGFIKKGDEVEIIK